LTTRKEELLQRVFGLSKELGKVDFPLIVKLSTGYDVIPINSSNELDKKFIDILNSILKKFLKTSASTRSRYQGNRVNEVGRRIEETIVNEMNKLPLSVKRLAKHSLQQAITVPLILMQKIVAPFLLKQPITVLLIPMEKTLPSRTLQHSITVQPILMIRKTGGPQ